MSILGNYVYSLIYNIAALIVPFLTAPYLARTLGAQSLGIFAYIQSTTAILCTVSMLGTYTFGNRQVAYTRDSRERMSREFCNVMGLRIALGVIGTAVYFAVCCMSELRAYFLLYYIYYIGFVIDCSWLYVGIEDMRVCMLKNLCAKVGGAFCVFIFVRNDEHLWRYVLILALSTFAANLSVYAKLGRHVSLRRPEVASLCPNLKAAFKLCLPTLVATVYLQVDKLMLGWLTESTVEITYYDQAEKIIMIPLSFVTVLSTVMMPRIANEFKKSGIERINRLLKKACGYSMLAASPLMFGIFAVAPKFVPWYLGDGYAPVADAIMILSPYVLTNTLLGISGGQYFTATDQIEILLKSNLVGMAANIITNGTLIPIYGYRGAAIATIFSQILMLVYQYRHMARQTDILPALLRQSKYLVYGGVMLACVWAVGIGREPSVWLTAAQVAVGVASYAAILLTVRDKQLKELLCTLKQRKFDKKTKSTTVEDDAKPSP